MHSFSFFQRMFSEEVFPKEFQETTLHMIIKNGKKRKEILTHNRFVHCKLWCVRVAEGLVVEDGLRNPLLENSSMYQIGGQPGHRPEELIFVMKSMIAMSKLNGKMLIIQFHDIEKYFDKEMI